jgi:hypothetical protein
VPERFGDNPFLKRFYEPGGIQRWGFQTEVSFLTQRVEQVREIAQMLAAGESVVTDFAPQQNLIFAKITVDPLEFDLYEQLFHQLFDGLPRPQRLICLDADLRKIRQRIRARGREMEDGHLGDLPEAAPRGLRRVEATPAGAGAVDRHHEDADPERPRGARGGPRRGDALAGARGARRALRAHRELTPRVRGPSGRSGTSCRPSRPCSRCRR